MAASNAIEMAPAARADHDTSSIETASKAFFKEKRRKWIARKMLVTVAFVMCFGIGYVAGFFTPHKADDPVPSYQELSQSPADSSINSTVFPAGNNTRWRGGSCRVPAGDECPVGYRERPPLLVVSLDGFKAGYMERGLTPALHRIRDCGVHAPSMRPTHPAITFPNHYSIATGLNSESHGIIDNVFYDEKLGRSFYYKNATIVGESVWWHGEPIWVTAKKNDKRAHAYFWVGTEANIGGYRPDEYRVFNASHPFEHRVDQVLEWLGSDDMRRPDVTMLYFEEPDSTGHYHGTTSARLNATLGTVDATIDRLMQGLQDRNILSCVNVIIVSDHGMEDVACENVLGFMPLLQSNPLTSAIKPADLFLNADGVHVRISMRNSSSNLYSIDTVYDALRCSAPAKKAEYPRYQVYKKENLPRRLHYTNTHLVEPLVVTVKAPYVYYANKNPSCTPGGVHGYDNLYPSQQSMFVAHGPSFKSGVKTEPFKNVELYNLMCDLIGVEPAPNNGTRGSLHQVLRNPKTLQPAQRNPPVLPAVPEGEELVRRQDQSCKLDQCQAAALDLQQQAEMLNQAQSLVPFLTTIHAPYGTPVSTNRSASAHLVLLPHSAGLSGFSTKLRVPLWTSALLPKNFTVEDFVRPATCARGDLRLSNTERMPCSEFISLPGSLTAAYLTPPEFAGIGNVQQNSRLTTNIVPMFSVFRNGIWKSLWRILAEWSAKDWKLNVQMGPVFDNNFPYGIEDDDMEITTVPGGTIILLPSHYFVIVTRDNRTPACIEETCLPDVLAFLLPHADFQQYCQDDRSYILTHTATVTDVEKATGLQFYTDVPVYEAIRLRTQMPTKLWDSDVGL